MPDCQTPDCATPGCPHYDLVIVGASFAGLIAAKTAAMRGLSVAVLEAKPDAGHRVATTGILVKEVTDDIDIPHTLTRRVHGVRLYAPNITHTDLFAPGYFFLTTDTAALLRWLASEAMRAGAHILYRTRFEGEGLTVKPELEITKKERERKSLIILRSAML